MPIQHEDAMKLLIEWLRRSDHGNYTSYGYDVYLPGLVMQALMTQRKLPRHEAEDRCTRWFQTFMHRPGSYVAAEFSDPESGPMVNRQHLTEVQETVIQLRHSDVSGLLRRITKTSFQRSQKDLVKCCRSFRTVSEKDIKPVDKRPCAAMEHTHTWRVAL